MESRNNNNDVGKIVRNIGLFVGIPLLVFLLVWLFFGGSAEKRDKPDYSTVVGYFQNEQVEHFDLDLGSGALKLTLKEEFRTDVNKDGKVDEKDIVTYTVPDINLFYNDLRDYISAQTADGLTYDYAPEAQLPWIINILPSLLIIVFFVLMWLMMRRSLSSIDGGGRAMGFGKARVRNSQDNGRKTTFADVAGADEEKEELEEIVSFLKSSRKYKDLGARVPKGVLLVGPPGTGKTLLARAVAGEAGVPFFSISGSDFVEMYVGVGASRVRALFDQAKKNSPCIIFIDEIDAVGRQRGAGLGGGHDEREQTLNQLLVEMDGFGTNDGVIMMAATNRPDILDPALMRPGRFDRQIVVHYPDIKGREEILKIHARGKPMAPDVDLSVVAKTTAGFTGADLENLLNEAALLAARRDQHSIVMENIEEAAIKVMMGAEKKSRVITEEDKRITACHEAGHAVTTYYCPTQDPVHQISIIPRGMAAGFTMNLPKEDRTHMTKTAMLESLQVLLGGRVAESLMLDDICTGASNDIERASETARKMVTRYGMSEKLGPIVFGTSDDEVFLGRDFGHTRNYSEEIAAEIDEEVNRLIMDAYAETTRKLQEHRDQLQAVADFLIAHEKMEEDEFEALMRGDPLPTAPAAPDEPAPAAPDAPAAE